MFSYKLGISTAAASSTADKTPAAATATAAAFKNRSPHPAALFPANSSQCAEHHAHVERVREQGQVPHPHGALLRGQPAREAQVSSSTHA
jgi:hypothetical protein